MKTKVETTASPEEMAELLGSDQWARQLSPTDNTWLVLVVGLNQGCYSKWKSTILYSKQFQILYLKIQIV